MPDSVVNEPDIVAFLRARYDEREAKARAADVKQGDPQWFVSPVAASWPRNFTVRSRQDNRPIAYVQDLAGDDGGGPQAILDGAATAAHIADNDPRYVLDDIAAKRRIVDLVLDEDNGVIAADRSIECEWGCTSDLHEQLLKLLALPFAGHPEYREEWRP